MCVPYVKPLPQNSENKPRGLYFSRARLDGRFYGGFFPSPVWGAYIFVGGGGGLIHGGAYFRNFTVCLKTIKILLISNSCIMLSIDIAQWRNVFRAKGVTLPSTPSEHLYEKKIDPFAHANKWRWAAQQKWLHVEMLARVRGRSCHHKGQCPGCMAGHPPSQANPLFLK